MDFIEIERIEAISNILRIKLRFSSSISKYFTTDTFECVYSEKIDSIDNSVLVIPVLAQILPISWLTDAVIVLDSIDKNFYNSIPEIKRGYQNMYPMLSFKGSMKVNDIVSNTKMNNQRSASLFSGGLDAIATLIAHEEEHPDLIMVHGADIPYEEKEGWNIALSQNQKIAELFNLSLRTIESNFTTFVDQHNLNRLSIPTHDNWWHGFQHGLGLLGLCAPLSVIYDYSKLYIASSHTERDNVSCASDPSIDNYVRFASCRVIHDQYEYNRLQKTLNIVSFSKSKKVYPHLRVCYRNKVGDNCCRCEKCIRTAAGIVISGESPEKYGFNKKDIFKNSKLKVILQLNYSAVPLWEDMQNYLIENTDISLPKDLNWLRKCNFHKELYRFHYRAIHYILRHSSSIKKWMQQKDFI